MMDAVSDEPIDYSPCSYGTSRLTFRGPERSRDGPYVAVIGGSETFGRFVERPFADILEVRLGLPVVNLGCMYAGLTAFREDPAAVDIASGAMMTVVQVLGAANMSNRYYTVHPRRNDRFLAASKKMKQAFPSVDFTEFHFIRHMLTTLEEANPQAFRTLVTELRTAWHHRMLSLLRQIQSPTLFLWMSDRSASASAGSAWDHAPLFVDGRMIGAVAGETLGVVEVAPPPDRHLGDTRGAALSDGHADAAALLPDKAFHDRAAAALEARIRPIVWPETQRRRAG